MGAKIEWNGYGKCSVRVMRVARANPRHELKDLSVSIQLEGDFESVHTQGDNSSCLPTDTMKNTVYVLAKQHGIGSIEDFGRTLAAHFVESHAPVARATVEIAEKRWSRVTVDGKPHAHTFVPAEGGERRTTKVSVERGAQRVESGLEGLLILKTTGSSFGGFPRDAWTTLPEAADRVFSTLVSCTWQYSPKAKSVAWDEVWQRARTALVETFARHDESRSVQHTLYAMGEAVLARCPEIESLKLSLPNKHCLLFDLGRFGLSNANEVFVPTDEPYGLIEATLRR